MVKKTLATLFFVAAAVVTTASHADTYNFSYISDDTLFNAAGQLFTTGNNIISMTGTVNGIAITSLIGSPGIQNSPSGNFIFDNTLYAGPTLSTYGVLFSVTGDLSGQEWNMWGNGGTSGSLYSYVPGTGYSPATDGTLVISGIPLPEPASLAMLLAGLGLMGAISLRHKWAGAGALLTHAPAGFLR